jgi:hypothetical protein
MIAKNSALAALAGIAIMAAGTAVAGQAPKPTTPPATSAPATPARLAPPIRGAANVQHTRPVTKSGKVDGKDFIITTMRIKNMSAGAIAGLRVDEFWLDKAGNPVGGDTFRSRRPIQPNEIVELTFQTPRNPAMNSNQYRFSHANGDIKTVLVPRL